MKSFIKTSVYVKNILGVLTAFILAASGITGALLPAPAFGDDAAPEISLTHQGVEIPNGDTTPSLADFTDYGSAAVGTGVSIGGYNVNNTGTVPLHLTGESPYVFITGENAADFTVTVRTYKTVNPGLSIAIQITFHPSSPGLKTATVSIPNDDSDENPYTFSIQGTGVESAPEIYVTGNGAEIISRHNTVKTTDGTNFGSVSPGGETRTSTFVIYNTGSSPLNLTGSPSVTISGALAAEFAVTAQPSSPIAAGGSTTFQVTFAPAEIGTGYAIISIPNDDSDENPYTINIQGTGAGPQICVAALSKVIVNGDSSPSVTDFTDFGTAVNGGGSVVHTFFIRNTGTVQISLTGGSPYAIITGEHAADFTVTVIPSPSVAIGSSNSFQITFHPSGAGLRQATVSIPNTVPYLNPYTFSIQGTGLNTPEISVTGNGRDITDGDTTPSTSDFTDFGGIDISSSSVVHEFYITNSGLVPLNLAGTPIITISGANAADFTVNTLPVSPIVGGGSTTFQISFHPSAGGLRTAIVSIANDDINENPYNFSIQGAGGVGEIKVTGNGQNINDGDITPSTTDYTDFGSTPIFHYPVSATFKIYNTGSNTLYLNGAPAVAISGANASEFTVSTPPAATVEPGNYTSFTITFRPITPGNKSAAVSIDNNDPDENPYNFNIKGFATAPNIILAGNGHEILNGDITPSAADFTDFGTVDIGSAGVTHIFTITNTGDAPYEIYSEYPYIGTNNTDFTISSISAMVIPIGGSITFQMTFRPSVAGLSTDDVLITNKWGDEETTPPASQINFRVQGTGTGPAISITGNGHQIADGDTTPSPADATDFGLAGFNPGSITHTYTITNTGSIALNLTGTPLVAISGPDAADFTVTLMPVSPVAYGSSTTFQIRFAPNGAGLRTAAVSIANNEIDKNPYSFNIQGTGNSQIIVITGDGQIIADGDNTPSATDSTEFGSARLTGATIVHNFTINNTGSGQLSLTGTPLVAISGLNAADFTVTLMPGSSIPGGSSAVFRISFDPSAAGLRTATVTIIYNNQNENPYNFNIQGTGSDSTSPIITSALYDASTGVLTVTGVNLVSLPGVNNDIDTSKFTFTGKGGRTYTLTAGPVDITSGISFSVALSATDKAAVIQLLDHSGTSSSDGIVYNLAAAEDWAMGADAQVTVADLTNSVTVSLGTPEIDITCNGDIFYQYGTYDFGTVPTDNKTTVTFIIKNNGSVPLVIQTPITLGGYTNILSITRQPQSLLEAGGETQLTISLYSLDPMFFGGGLTIANNDHDESYFEIYFSGYITEKEITKAPAANEQNVPDDQGNISLSGNVLDDGIFPSKLVASSQDDKISLTFYTGSRGLDKNSNPLEAISILPATAPRQPLTGSIVAQPYHLGPDGAVFNPGLTLSITYDPSQLPAGRNEADLVLAWYNETTQTWVELNSTVNTQSHTVNANITHFSLYAIIGKIQETTPPNLSVPTNTTIPQPATPAPEPVQTPISPQTVAPSQVTKTEPGQITIHQPVDPTLPVQASQTPLLPPYANNESTDFKTDWLLPGSVFGGIVVLVIIIFVIIRKRREV